jgi:hypothetical protein
MFSLAPSGTTTVPLFPKSPSISPSCHYHKEGYMDHINPKPGVFTLFSVKVSSVSFFLRIDLKAL